MNKGQLTKDVSNDDEILKALIPGRNLKTESVRSQIKSFSRNSSSCCALLIGPIGSGKSTIARVMALMRFLYFCPDERRKNTLENLRFDGPFRIDKKFLGWFEEINLTGLVDTLAQSQLFGVARGAATSVTERAGIFEQAMYGHSPKGKESDAARLTRGVVFLDEIGDLSPQLQPLLLMVLTGAEVFRVGGEGDPKYGYSFNGSVIAATWRDPFQGSLRRDLLSRLMTYVIQLPGLNDKKDEFDEIVNAILEDIHSNHNSYIDSISLIQPELVSRAKLKHEREKKVNLDQASIELLKEQDWSKRGDLRGLRQILERCFYDEIPVLEALVQSTPLESAKSYPKADTARLMIEEICDMGGPIVLSDEIRKIEKQARRRLVDLLQADQSLLRKVAERARVDVRVLKRQLSHLVRDRSKK
ncbi:MAG: sigma 54-interacting transcriptional regulator [Thermodesulfobacteriota bacterium]